MIIDEENKKIVEMEEFSDVDDAEYIQYTLEKQSLEKWMITDIGIYLSYYDDLEKQLYCNDKFSLIASSQIDNYTSENVLDDNLQTAWVEGVDDNGIGEWLEIKTTGNNEVSGIKLINGYVKIR